MTSASSATWMYFGNKPQFNANPFTPMTEAQADSLNGYKAVGPNQISAVTVSAANKYVVVDNKWTKAWATSYNGHNDGYSTMNYTSPTSGAAVKSVITGFAKVDYRLTMPDGTTQDQSGVMMQMYNGDMFFRPSLQTVDAWKDIDQLNSVQILDADPLPRNTYVAQVSFKPSIFDLVIVCFAADTMIRTAKGDVAVQDLREGDMIWTRDNGFQPLRWVGVSHLDAIDLAAKPKLLPIRIKAGALGADMPAVDLVVSPQHRVLVRSAIAQRMFGAAEVLVAAKHLTELPGIDVDTTVTTISYHHLMFDAHEVVMSNGAETESLYPGPQALRALGAAALAEIEAIFPGIMQASPASARPFAQGAKVRQMASRHMANSQPLAS
ncbi:Hint domain-containing protein [Paracoccus indicus]|uniref:Hint domain-containing protein n=1 Tax=Paracoccus indicus TaxID=2079229 RepID=UPI001FEA7F53|nr:Hint domain-containing protein [Paracoccus indicus]